MKQLEDEEDGIVEKRTIWDKVKYIKVFIGRDDGEVNFVLVEYKRHKYMYTKVMLGNVKVGKFSLQSTGDEIVELKSNYGNNYVPYPVMIGKTYTYLLDGSLKVVKIKNEVYRGKILKRNIDDLYRHFFALEQLNMRRNSAKKMTKKDKEYFEQEIKVARQWAEQFTNA